MKIFCHRGKFGCTDINREYLTSNDAKGLNLKNLPPENSEESIKAAFTSGFCVETDVVMTKDRKLIATHTNDLSLHSFQAKKGDYASNMTFEQIMKMKTGMGGKTSEFLTYEKLMGLLEEYPNLSVNIEIKGTIEPKNSLPELQNPSIIEQIVKLTPSRLFSRIIWSSFATSNLIKLKTLKKDADTAQLFTFHEAGGQPVYPDTDDKYLTFTLENIKKVVNKTDINAFHAAIDSLNDINMRFCNDNKIAVRTWKYMERNPEENELAKQDVLTLAAFSKKYPNLEIDIITDYAEEISRLI
ncbi:MAG: hypothetical protein LBR70_03465 [Lactobacillaceae bacterium]|jgi:glycerophosphoryl diester phosphodiesterase|nr:hypothetical protein [Lactobacillaceae bacterium]